MIQNVAKCFKVYKSKLLSEALASRENHGESVGGCTPYRARWKMENDIAIWSLVREMCFNLILPCS